MKTPALDFLVKHQVQFKEYTYVSDNHDFATCCACWGMDEHQVFKTIILKSRQNLCHLYSPC